MKKKRRQNKRVAKQAAWSVGGVAYEEGVEQKIPDAFAVGPDVIAAASGLSTVSIHTLHKRGIIRQSGPGKYHLYETMQAICNYMKQGDAFSNLATRREKKLTEEIRKIQLANDLEEGRLVPLEHAHSVVAEICAIVRMGHESLGGRLSNELAGITEPAKIRAVLQRETRAIDKDTADKLKNLSVVRDQDGHEEHDEEDEEGQEHQKRA